jgi:DNA-binding winged helix-turn-helix (wHTH) protein
LRYLFEDYTFDTERRELHRGADAVSITPQVFDLLEYLIRNRERVVSKDDLIGTVWNGRIVSNAALTTRLNAVRNAIGDSGEKQCLIKTLPRKGFRFVGTVQEAPMGVIAAVVGGSGDQSDAVPGGAVVRHGPDVSIQFCPARKPLGLAPGQPADRGQTDFQGRSGPRGPAMNPLRERVRSLAPLRHTECVERCPSLRCRPEVIG